MAAPQDLSAGYAPLIEAVQRDMVAAGDEPPLVAACRLGGLLRGERTCPACRLLAETERTAILDLLGRVSAGGRLGQTALDRGWCLAHLRAALATEPEPDVARRLLRAQAEQLEETLEDMRSSALKRTAVRGGIINAREPDGWQRALVRLVGERAARGIMLGDGSGWTA